MPSLQEVENAVETLKGYHQSLNLTIGEDIQGEHGETEHRGFWITDTDPQEFYVIGTPDIDYLEVVFVYDLIQDIANRMSEEVAQKFADPADDVDDLSIKEWAAVNILDGIDESDIETLEFRLREYLSAKYVWADMEYTRTGQIKGFYNRTRVFPYHEEVSISDYEDRLTTLLEPSQKAYSFLVYSLNMWSESENIADVGDVRLPR